MTNAYPGMTQDEVFTLAYTKPADWTPEQRAKVLAARTAFQATQRAAEVQVTDDLAAATAAYNEAKVTRAQDPEGFAAAEATYRDLKTNLATYLELARSSVAGASPAQITRGEQRSLQSVGITERNNGMEAITVTDRDGDKGLKVQLPTRRLWDDL